MKIGKLIKALRLPKKFSVKSFAVKGLSCNSKIVKEGFVFVAVKGSAQDGNKYIGEAIENGARVIVFEGVIPISKYPSKASFIKVSDSRAALARLAAEFYGNPSRKIKVAGITGTNGKTTVSYLLEAILKERGLGAGIIGTINCHFKNKTIPSKNTTPGPLELQSMLSEMKKGRCAFAAMEVSSHALDQDRVKEIDFHSAIFTNLTQDHLDYHKTFANYFESKSKLFKNLSRSSFAVINNDDPYGPRLKKMTKAKVITYGIKAKSDFMAQGIKPACDKTEFTLVSKKAKFKLTMKLIGRHNIYNVLAAIAWGFGARIEPRHIKSAVEKFSFVPGRLEKLTSKKGFTVFVDYAHTEDALKNILTSLREVSQKKIITVFGCGGERDKRKRPKMGKVVSRLSDFFVITNDNPRSENPLDIISDIKRGIRKENYCVITQRQNAIKKSLSLAGLGDIVLVAGKGHENYQVLKDRVVRFDDREVVRECLRSMNY